MIRMVADGQNVCAEGREGGIPQIRTARSRMTTDGSTPTLSGMQKFNGVACVWEHTTNLSIERDN
jgi:hypothetical protein